MFVSIYNLYREMDKMGKMFNLFFSVVKWVALKESFVSKGDNDFSCNEILYNNLKLCFKRIFNILKHDYMQNVECKTIYSML